MDENEKGPESLADDYERHACGELDTIPLLRPAEPVPPLEEQH